MKVHVHLNGILRDKLPPEDHGRVVLDVPEGTTITEVLANLNLSGHLHVFVNEKMEKAWETPLQDGDNVEVSHAGTAG